MTGGNRLLDTVIMTLRGHNTTLDVYIDVFDNSLSRKWLAALNQLLAYGFHLEKNYCWMGWTGTDRDVALLCDRINHSIEHINHSDLDYAIECIPFAPNNVIGQDLDIVQIGRAHV